MKYLVIEIQTALVDGEEVVSNIVTVHDTINEAEQKYHTILSYAAVSNILSHSATLMTDRGQYVKSEYYPVGGIV